MNLTTRFSSRLIPLLVLLLALLGIGGAAPALAATPGKVVAWGYNLLYSGEHPETRCEASGRSIS